VGFGKIFRFIGGGAHLDRSDAHASKLARSRGGN
jgi:hypothetical protein